MNIDLKSLLLHMAETDSTITEEFLTLLIEVCHNRPSEVYTIQDQIGLNWNYVYSGNTFSIWVEGTGSMGSSGSPIIIPPRGTVPGFKLLDAADFPILQTYIGEPLRQIVPLYLANQDVANNVRIILDNTGIYMTNNANQAYSIGAPVQIDYAKVLVLDNMETMTISDANAIIAAHNAKQVNPEKQIPLLT